MPKYLLILHDAMPVIALRFRFISSGYCGSTVTPVPTAEPPMPRSLR